MYVVMWEWMEKGFKQDNTSNHAARVTTNLTLLSMSKNDLRQH